ncbi:MAG TPA: dihydrolipoamide acetyltransferase family protein [Gemmataceae bacterium]|nr:dihydrolipoamide acetyltransferase family protein [Gemmataceae bacterium]
MEFQLPELGEGVYEAELVSWLVKVGDSVKHGQNLMEVLTDKASMEVPAPFTGCVTELRAEPGQSIKVGDVVLTYTPAGQQEPRDGTGAEISASKRNEDGERKTQDGERVASAARRFAVPSTASPPHGLAVRAAPSVRYLARKLGVDLQQVRGSGPEGRVLIDDLSPFLDRAQPEGKPPAREARPDYGTPGTRIKLQGIRRKIAEHMVHSKRTIPHYTYVDECDVTELVRLRNSLRETYEQAGIKLTYLAFFVKAVAAALKEVPIVNATLEEKAGEILLHDHYHIGIAVAAPTGLIVPVIHDADRLDLGQIAREIERLSREARTGKARLEDLRGGTFTITSIGGVGGLFSTPVINHPEVAILGVGKVVKRPLFDAAGQIRPADILYLSLSFDHRVLDGAIGAAFGNALCRRLQNPAVLLLPDKF